MVQIIQRDAFERLNMKSLMLEPEFLSTLEADVHLVADLISLRSAIPEKTKETARQVVRKVVQALMARLEYRTVELLRGALNRSQRTRRPRSADIDWGRTIGANLRHYRSLLSEFKTPLEVQQALMRHADISTTMEYGESPMENKREANSTVVREILRRKSSQ